MYTYLKSEISVALRRERTPKVGRNSQVFLYSVMVVSVICSNRRISTQTPPTNTTEAGLESNCFSIENPVDSRHITHACRANQYFAKTCGKTCCHALSVREKDHSKRMRRKWLWSRSRACALQGSCRILRFWYGRQKIKSLFSCLSRFYTKSY